MKNKIRIGAFISGGGTNLQAIIDACENGSLDGRIVFIGTDNPQALGLEKAKKHSIPSFIVDYASIIHAFKAHPEKNAVPDDFDLQEALAKQSLMRQRADLKRIEIFLKSRAIAEATLLNHIASYPFDLLVLAGFMRNLSPYFIDRVNTNPQYPKIMNIHPALLPSFPGVDGYGDTYRYGCKIGGCTVHFIDYGEDSGPIIGQKSFPIQPDDDLDIIKKKGLEKEWELYPECIQLYAEKRLHLSQIEHTTSAGTTKRRTIVKISTS